MRLDDLDFKGQSGFRSFDLWRVAEIDRGAAHTIYVYQPTESNSQQQQGHYAILCGKLDIGGEGAFTCIPPLQAQAIILGILDGSIET
ncbi:hypothetical protein [Pseudolabrys sp.]|uniref:hypothetical protein n=1 Tax=Pseudolabrys sp. TaxID=1960880 RepID=UPI003D0EDF59